METRTARMIVNKSGRGSSTFRATLPQSWIRGMGLGEDSRDIMLKFYGEVITIVNNEKGSEKKKYNNELLKTMHVAVSNEFVVLKMILEDETDDKIAAKMIQNDIKDVSLLYSILGENYISNKNTESYAVDEKYYEDTNTKIDILKRMKTFATEEDFTIERAKSRIEYILS